MKNMFKSLNLESLSSNEMSKLRGGEKEPDTSDLATGQGGAKPAGSASRPDSVAQ